MVRRSQRRTWINLGQTRRSFPNSSSNTQKPATLCSAKTNHSCGKPLIRLSRPLRKASMTVSARLQSVRRADIDLLTGTFVYQNGNKKLYSRRMILYHDKSIFPFQKPHSHPLNTALTTQTKDPQPLWR